MATKTQVDRALARYAAASARGQMRRARGDIATSARYDVNRERVHVELQSGSAFAVPVHLLQGLKGAKRAQLQRVTVTGGGMGLHWPDLDVDLSIPDLLAGSLGTRAWMKALGKRGGSKTSGAKAAAARENGKRGGRPRKDHASA